MAATAVISRPITINANIMTLGQSNSNTSGTTMLSYQPHQYQHQQQHNSIAQSSHVMRPLHASNHSTSTAPKSIKPKIIGGQSLPAHHRHQPYPTQQPQTVSVQRRNARERNRVKQVNNGFSTLRQHIPTDVVAALSSGGRGASKKLSKVDTLKVAVEYIRRLEDLLDEVVNDENASCASSDSSSSSGNGSISGADYYGGGNASPTPSYCSSSVESTSSASSASHSIHQHPAMYKYETDAEPSAYNPDDEELLDCITWWQQQ